MRKVSESSLPEPDRPTSNYSIFNQLFPRIEPTSFDPVFTMADHKGAKGVEARVARTNTGTVLFDPFRFLCPISEGGPGACPLEMNGETIYLDSWHLTRSGSLLLTLPFSKAIEDAAGRRYVSAR
jgi:hypothetical protein